MTAAAPIRCAIYTRKSTEEGLEQAFNSLDAQREACAAYIASQKHEGWMLSPELYDDGGFSGGNMHRPGLAALMAEVEAGCIQVIVVYKVDRLTRSLADFAKIVEVLDAKGASFVSVTQSFNTTTSMGRLTLNVLLSFAQFEREVIGERVRDKVAASKRKGMWMGGPVPLGYDVRDRKLVVNDTEAATVRHLFEVYLAAGSVVAALAVLARDSIFTKVSRTRDGVTRGGIAFTRGSLGHLLANRIYRGEIGHLGQHYPGEHAAIIDQKLWDDVADLRRDNGVARASPHNIVHPSLLAGRLTDGLGRRMKPSHACKGARRYRYYVTAPDDHVTREQPALRIAARDLENVVDQQLMALLRDRARLHDALGDDLAISVANALGRAAALADGPNIGDRLALITAVVLHHDQVEIAVDLGCLLGRDGSTEGAPLAIRTLLTAPVVRIRRGLEVRLIIADRNHLQQAVVDPALAGLIGRAHAARKAVLASPALSIEEHASNAGLTPAYFTRLLRLSWLAPDLVVAILAGNPPRTLTRERLARATLPLSWGEQRTMLEAY